MADNKLTREIYLNYAKKIVSVLYGDEFFNQYKKRVESGYADFKLVKKRLIQDISIDWISTIEQVLPNLDTIVRNPRKFIVQEEDIVDISLCKAISTESVKHLAQHTNMISKVDKDGTVTPSRILNITKEESYEIYENRFIYTLLLKLKDFVSIRYDKIKKASATQDVLQLNVDSKFNLPSKKVTYRTEYMAQLSFDEVMRMDAETLEKIERIAKIDKIITDFLASSFAKAMRNSAPVRPPITRTNVILKEPNFKKALTLWQFIETYQATGGFSTSDDIEDIKVETESQQQLRQMVTLNTMLFESLYDQHETDMDLDDAQFTDLLRVGDLDFAKDEIQRDEFAQKLEEEQKDEADKEEETEEPPTPPEEPEVEIEEEEVEVEVEQEVEIEKEVDKDVTVEAPPKDEPEDEEPDAEEFDQHLFDVRKLYKRPEDDKLRQEEISKVKDAIDRCLMSYRKIKQEELDDREREEALRRRTEELERRAEAFRQRKQQLEKEQGQVYLGNDAFDKADVKAKDDFKKAHQELFVNKNEKLSLTDDDLENIRKSIEIMDHERAKTEAKYKIAFAGDNDKVIDEAENDAEIPTVDLEKQLAEKAHDEEVRKELLGEAKPRKKASKPVAEEAIPARNGLNLGRNLLSGGNDIGSELKGVFIDRRETQPEQKEVKEVKPVKTIAKPVSADKAVKRQRAIAIVDESKVGVGDSPIKGLGTNALLDGTFGEQKADLGDLTKPNAPAPKRKPRAKAEVKPEETKVEVAEVKAETPVEAVKEPETSVKPNIRKSSGPIDPWSLSATTLNQKYDVASGKVRNFEAVDENKVKVGDAPVKGKDANDLLDDTFGEQRANLGITKTENPEVEEGKEEKPKAPRKPRAKKPTPAVTEEKETPASKTPAEAPAPEVKAEPEKAPEKPAKKKTSKPKTEEPKEDTPKAEEKVEEKAEEKAEEVVKPKIRKASEPKDPWGLSATTLNQKYDVPSGKVRNFAPVDENKVAVGKSPIRLASTNELLSTFGEQTISKPVIIKRDEEDGKDEE